MTNLTDPEILRPARQRLAHFPITFFACVMGLSGLALALQAAGGFYGVGKMPGHLALGLAAGSLLLIGIVYLAKAALYPAAVAEEWAHPVKLSFFPALPVSVLLVSTALLPEMPGLALPVWVLGAAGQGVLSLAVVSAWIGPRRFTLAQISPAWFIPAVGNLVVPVAGAPLGYAGVSMLFFVAGMIFWVVLLTVVLQRLILEAPMPPKLQPTLAILMAPPAVGFIAWLSLNGGVADGTAHALFHAALVFAALVTVQLPGILRAPFALSWWALSFPLAALTIAMLRFASLTGHAAMAGLGRVLLFLLVVTVAGLLARTLRAMARGEICRPE